MPRLGVGELLVMLLLTIVVVLPWWKIISKAGYGGALSLLLLVPIANLVLVFWFAFADWPVLRELRNLKARGLPPGPAVGRDPFQRR